MPSRSRKTTRTAPSRRVRKQPGKILDLFAGAGGWEEGLRPFGLKALGIETDPHACATAQAAGHERLQADVAALDPVQFAPVWGLIGSPPCQAYSSAGKGLGRADKPSVIVCARELAADNDTRAARLKECHDPRSLLTVEPLRYAIALRPRWIALEQVPAVLELWSLFASLLALYGYHTAVGVLSAEQYGVPQTRKRAFLIASLDGPVQLPAPTHRSYNPRRKETPEDERDLLPWVSMAEALSWGMTARPGMTVVAGNKDGESKSRACMARQRRSGAWVEIRRGKDRIHEGFDPASSPGQAVTSRVDRWQAHGVEDSACERPPECAGELAERPAPTIVTTRRSKEGALIGRQLPPGESCERGGWAWRNGNQAHSAVRDSREPAPTVHFGHRVNKVEWVPCSYDARQRGARPRPIDQPAPTMLAHGLAKGVPTWSGRRPATTIACDRRVHPPGHKQNAGDPPGRYEQRRGAHAIRVTVCQAAFLQGFRADYPWQGAKIRQFEQVGNAVPPPLAHRVLGAAMRKRQRRTRARAGASIQTAPGRRAGA
ncbi:MAG: DNA cytosine methyltransferase [Solirubrobacteraceae bacterium]